MDEQHRDLVLSQEELKELLTYLHTGPYTIERDKIEKILISLVAPTVASTKAAVDGYLKKEGLRE